MCSRVNDNPGSNMLWLTLQVATIHCWIGMALGSPLYRRCVAPDMRGWCWSVVFVACTMSTIVLLKSGALIAKLEFFEQHQRLCISRTREHRPHYASENAGVVRITLLCAHWFQRSSRDVCEPQKHAWRSKAPQLLAIAWVDLESFLLWKYRGTTVLSIPQG